MENSFVIYAVNINSYYCLSSNNEEKKIVSLSTIINGDVNVKCYDSNDIVTNYFWTTSQNKFSSLYPLNVHKE